jgi:hypothetical protein
MITGVHSLVYASDPELARAFFRDVVRLPHADAGGGWLIFASGPSELALHPNRWEHEGNLGATDQTFDLSLMCDDLTATVAELKGRGARFDDEIVEQPWGHTIRMHVPGTGAMTLYEPTYDPPATSL